MFLHFLLSYITLPKLKNQGKVKAFHMNSSKVIKFIIQNKYSIQRSLNVTEALPKSLLKGSWFDNHKISQCSVSFKESSQLSFSGAISSSHLLLLINNDEISSASHKEITCTVINLSEFAFETDHIGPLKPVN